LTPRVARDVADIEPQLLRRAEDRIGGSQSGGR